MKAKILTIALLAATLSGYATPIDEAPSTPPTNVIAVFDDIIGWYQIPSETLLEEKRNATDNSIEHSVKVYTFQVEEYKHVIRDARQAFEKDAPLSYQYGLYEPGHKDTFRICTGDTPDKYIITRTQDNQGPGTVFPVFLKQQQRNRCACGRQSIRTLETAFQFERSADFTQFPQLRRRTFNL